MSYYKVFDRGKIIDANDVFLRWQAKHKSMMSCAPESAQFIQSSDGAVIWRVAWLNEVPDELKDKYDTVDAQIISEEEYLSLRSVFDAGTDVEIEYTEPAPVPIPEDVPEADVSLDYLKQLKISALSSTCNAVITSGVDVELSDGTVRHFSMTVEDQLNIVSLSALIMQGQAFVPYHADGETCIMYSAADFQRIATEATSWKIYHEAYFNSLKSYVSVITDAEELSKVEYGAPIPAEYQSEVYQQLLMNGGS